MLVFRSPAKINLSLDILSRREDGYHELQSVAHCIGLYDVVKFEFLRDEEPLLQFSCNDESLESDSNLCKRAVREYLNEWANCGVVSGPHSGSLTWAGVRITLQKNIPVGAGLGGGSSNAAAVLRAMLHRYERSLDEDSLLRVAAKLGADVPLFLKGGCLMMEGIGDKLTSLPTLEGAVVLIVPDQHASTPAIYRRFDEREETTSQSTPSVLESARQKDLKTVARHLGNDLEPAARDLGIDVALPALLLKKHGALGAQMSGSGAASFGLFHDKNAAQSAKEKILSDEDLPKDYCVFIAPLISGGVELLSKN